MGALMNSKGLERELSSEEGAFLSFLREEFGSANANEVYAARLGKLRDSLGFKGFDNVFSTALKPVMVVYDEKNPTRLYGVKLNSNETEASRSEILVDLNGRNYSVVEGNSDVDVLEFIEPVLNGYLKN